MRRLTALALVLALALGACGTSANTRDDAPKPDPAFRWAERVRARVVKANEQPAHRVRHNPAPCDCPPFEVELDGIWHRVAFAGADPEDEVMLALEAALNDARRAGAARVWEMQGSLDDQITTCARGAIVVSLTPSVFGPPEPPEVEPSEVEPPE